MDILSRRIRQRREDLGITQEQLGDLIGKDQKQVWRYETARNQPTADVLLQFARALDTTADWLLGLTDNPKRPLRGEGDLDGQEREVIELFRAYDQDTKQQAVKVLKALG